MAPVNEAKVPTAHKAKQRFIEAMDDWNEEAADGAVASLVRSAGATEVIESFWRYGARDFRAIGHKAIFVANAWRTLQTIGWRHAEPIMRSLAYALQAHEGDNPASATTRPTSPSATTGNAPAASALTGSAGRSAATPRSTSWPTSVRRRPPMPAIRSSRFSTRRSTRPRCGTRCFSRPASC